MKSVDKYGRPQAFLNGHNGRKYPISDRPKWDNEKRYRKRNRGRLRASKRNHYRKQKLRAMRLKGNKCTHCGVEYNGKNAPIFEFHHPDPSVKEGGVTRMLRNKAWTTVMKELERTVLICANCHNQHHGSEW